MIRIRPFEAADYDEALVLWSSAEHLGPVPRDEVEQKLQRDPELFLAADRVDGDSRALVGVVMGSSDGRRGWIARLVVAAEERGRGIGQALVEELERRFLQSGITRVNLLVLSDNAGGRAFWERLGYPGFEPVVLHSKDLHASGRDGPGC